MVNTYTGDGEHRTSGQLEAPSLYYANPITKHVLTAPDDAVPQPDNAPGTSSQRQPHIELGLIVATWKTEMLFK